MIPVAITVNGKVRKAHVEPRTLLVHFLREHLNLTGTHVGCDTSQCGSCTVLVDGRSAKACTIFAVQADGSSAVNLLQDNPSPSEQQIREGISGNFCRCTGYQHIVNAIQSAVKNGAKQAR